jgi:hypothetical protein
MALSQVVRLRGPQEVALEIAQREFPNYHPMVSLVRLAHREDVVKDPHLEADIHKSLLPYLMPKLSSIEVKTNNADDRRVIVSLFETQELENGRTVDVEVPLVTDVSEIVPLD